MARSKSTVAHLTVISPPFVSDTPESVSERVRRLQAEARSLAREQVAELERKLEEVAAIARDIYEGGDAYPVGAREIARRLVDDNVKTVQTLEAILCRT